MKKIQAGINIPREPLPIEWPEEKVHPFYSVTGIRLAFLDRKKLNQEANHVIRSSN
jgi:hypothetical protein